MSDYQLKIAQIILGFLGGGVVGAFIKQYFDNKKSKKQPIGYNIEVKSFYNSDETKLVNAQVILQGEQQDYKFSRLFTGTIKVYNIGQNDYPSFTFGVTCDQGIKFIHLNQESIDRHHIAKFNPSPSLENQVSQFDIDLIPFNRKDTYSFDFLASSDRADFKTSSIVIGSSLPVSMETYPNEFAVELIREISSTSSTLIPAPFQILEALVSTIFKRLIK